MEINEKTNIGELLEAHPEVEKVFSKFDLHCAGCVAAAFDTIGKGCEAHGFEEEKTQALLEKLNAVINLDVQPDSENREDQVD